MPEDVVLSLRGVEKRFGATRAVDGVSFEVRRGTITGLLGRNGAGKTTTLRMITGIFLPDAGAIDFPGAGGSARAGDAVGYLPEERGLYKQMRVLEHLLFLAEIKGRRAAATRPAALEWLRRLELYDKRDARIEELSKGNQQKVQLIGALLHDPEIVLLDEPMSGLDPVNVVLVRRILKELKARGRTILLSTHNMGEAEKTVDDIILIHAGRVVLQGSMGDVRRSFGRDHVHLQFEGDGAFLESLPGVAGAAIERNAAELRLEPGADAQPVVRAASERLRIHRLEVSAPSLEEIFIERVGGAADDAATAPAAAPTAAR